MARARNIKPSIMENEVLAALDPIDRLLFIYLWMLADREGRLEDRPKRICKQALAYDDEVDADAILTRLHAAGFIKRYVVADAGYIQIINFVKHQAPHGTERDGHVPDENGMLTVHERTPKGYATGNKALVPCAVTGESPSEDGALTVKAQGSNSLIPDSGFLIPDSKNTPHTPQGGKRVRKPKGDLAEVLPAFEVFYAAYPRKVGRAAALKAWLKLAPDEALRATILGALAAQRPHLDFSDDKKHIPHASTWINGERWTDEIPGGTKPAPVSVDGVVWWQAAGFEHPGEAANARCHVLNYREFRDGKRATEEVSP